MPEQSASPGSIRLFAAWLALVAVPLQAADLKLAVASNFKPAMEELIVAFEANSGHEVTASYASTGVLYAQIAHGAPFDVFLAANSEHPEMLERVGVGVSGTRVTYAVGALVLWGAKGNAFTDGRQALSAGDYRFLAIANPKLAPYGRAAQQTLENLGLWTALQPRIVRGENVAQAFGYVVSGNAELGLVALSQIRQAGERPFGTAWLVPQELYSPIEQQAVLLRDDDAGRRFMEFLVGKSAGLIINRHGYPRS